MFETCRASTPNCLVARDLKGPACKCMQAGQAQRSSMMLASTQKGVSKLCTSASGSWRDSFLETPS